MLTKQHKIIEAFAGAPWKPLTFKKIKEISKNKSDNYVHATLKEFVKKNIITQEKIGNSIIYSINNNTHALNTIGYVLENKANSLAYLPHKNLNKIIQKIKTSFYSLIITGSYAKKTQKPDSDIDIVILCDDTHNPAKILSEIRMESKMMQPEIHPYVFSESQFYEMLTNKKENYGKEIAKNNLIITGAKQYYAILIRAIENGFKG
ncbi:nucleotidyltransferase domain-containing protein [Candidatus Woesearchaeota archaeon]|nr:nucleotidyltransferase domain-containing protein [Candidatus Woesearchaeota archaeon]